MERMELNLKLNFNNPAENDTPNYEFCRNTKTYLNQERKSCQLDDKTVAEKTGYRNFSKFLRKRELWHIMKMSFPRKYLEVIGVDWNTLEYAVEIDNEAFLKELEKKQIPDRFIVRYFAAMYGNRDIP